jgi:hypothetical protein
MCAASFRFADREPPPLPVGGSPLSQVLGLVPFLVVFFAGFEAAGASLP